MRRMSAVVDHETTWVQQPGFKSEYEMRFGDELIATLKFPKMLSSVAAVQCEDGSWTFERVGLLRAKTVIRPVNSDKEIATYTASAWKTGGIIELSGERKLMLRTNIWQSMMEICKEDEESIVQLKGRGFFKYCVDVRMNRSALQWPELPWLVALAFYQMIMMRRDSASHSAAH